jgi:hypothetical protein
MKSPDELFKLLQAILKPALSLHTSALFVPTLTSKALHFTARAGGSSVYPRHCCPGSTLRIAVASRILGLLQRGPILQRQGDKGNAQAMRAQLVQADQFCIVD